MTSSSYMNVLCPQMIYVFKQGLCVILSEHLIRVKAICLTTAVVTFHVCVCLELFFIYSSHINPLWMNHIITLLSWCPVFLICCLGTSTALFYRWYQSVMYSIHVAMQHASPRTCHECLCPIFRKTIYSISAEFCSPDIVPFSADEIHICNKCHYKCPANRNHVGMVLWF